MTPLLLSLAIYGIAYELNSRPLLFVACAMQIWGTAVAWKMIRDHLDGRRKNARHVRKHRGGKRIRKPAHKVLG